ncbi:MAG TPA: hypothetical protein VIX82_19520 [Solirubrobacteraceae bacterium]
MSIIPQLERDLFEAAQQRLSPQDGDASPGGPRPPARLRHLGYVAAAVAVIAVAGLFISLRGHSAVGPASGGGLRVVFSASSRDPSSPLGPALERASTLLRSRLASVIPDARVTLSGAALVVTVPHATRGTRAQVVALAAAGELVFYDWEANALTSDGATVASRLPSGNNQALVISQAGPGSAAGVPLVDAVNVASRQPPEPALDNARRQPEYYLFGAPASTACRSARPLNVPHPAHGCLLAGPADNYQALTGALPPGVRAAQAHVLEVPLGIAILQTVPVRFDHAQPLTSPIAQFYVLRDHAALLSNDITHPRQTIGPSGEPVVSISFTANGQRKFHAATAAIARRGALLSGPGRTLDQHFAVALDDRLVSVASIDFRAYPNGLPSDQGAEIAGGFTTRSAEIIAAMLRSGPLPVNLIPEGY